MSKKIVIIGYGSYLGSQIASWLKSKPNYSVEEFDLLGINPEIIDFTGVDVVIQAAGIEPGKERCNPNTYREVNCDLAYYTAGVARQYGVKQFFYLSTDSLGKINNSDEIHDLQLSDYAKSKLAGERKIQEWESDEFRIVILRLPKIVHTKLSSLLGKNSVKENVRKMCEIVQKAIDDEVSGTFFMQS
ncbi:NAD-dependent epimerase/dehydratase family protein [Frisingicoccus sp.]|uniref:NAD-dependent epimerase/dehydratase family protein n=1 Tax=Frisingicoccus sp. TaxID=1918627 RepID=UPI0025C2849A|nr:NAD-dependent epimerase/dehydratase family protein [Frisingicoccus sp.]